MIISQNTTWTAGNTYNLSEMVQVVPGAKLTIEAGAIVIGNGNSLQISGALAVNGTADDPVQFNGVNFVFGADAANKGRIDISNAVLNGGAFLSPTGVETHGSFSVRDTVFNETSYSYVSHPTEDSDFIHNIFYKSGGISLGVGSEPVGILGNVFLDWISSPSTTKSAITIWDNSDSVYPWVMENSFYGSGTVLAFSGNGSYLYSKDNYINYDDDLNVDNAVIDKFDDASLKGYALFFSKERPFAVSATLNDALNFRSDVINGTANRDVILAGAGNDTVWGGEGNDYIVGEAGHDYLRGDGGDDLIAGGSGFDDINGNAGADTLYGSDGDDWVVGGKDNDLQYGDNGNDIVYGNLGNDTVNGGNGADWVRGGQGDDLVDAGAGDDWISGDLGSDTLSGGSGADIFHTWGGAGLDRVKDFNRAEGDRVLLDFGTTYTVVQVGADTVINMTGGGQMILENAALTSLTGDWLYFG